MASPSSFSFLRVINMIMLKISIVSYVVTYIQNFLGSLYESTCGLVGLIVGVVTVTIFIYIKKRKKEM